MVNWNPLIIMQPMLKIIVNKMAFNICVHVLGGRCEISSSWRATLLRAMTAVVEDATHGEHKGR